LGEKKVYGERSVEEEENEKKERSDEVIISRSVENPDNGCISKEGR